MLTAFAEAASVASGAVVSRELKQSKNHVVSGDSVEIPYSGEQRILRREQGIFFEQQGNGW